ncbi:hypothetical protein TNCV_888101 [Trichonephila clavipes]|nr:hypothetical protein TNCV_888101 [Trichonephila clavipes]
MPSLPVPTEDVVSRVFIESSVLCGAGGSHPSWHGRRAGKPRQQPGQASGGLLPKSHVLWLGESGQRPRLSPSASG